MDFLSFAFLALFCLLGGIIAVYADRLGRVLGKQRRSLLGLRPRKTAEVIVFLGGVLVPMLTIMLVLVASSDVREWLLRGREAIAEAKRLTIDRDAKVKENTILDQRNKDLNVRVTGLNEQLEKLNRQVDEAVLASKKAQSDAVAARAQAAALTRNLRKVSIQLAAQQTELTATTSKLEKARKEYGSLNGSYRELDSQFRELGEDFNRKLEENSKLQRTNESLQQQGDELIRTIDGLTQDKGRLQGEVSEIQGRLNESQERLKKAQEDLERTNSELMTAQNDALRLGGLAASARTGKPMFLRGDEIARLSVDANLTPQEARQEVSRLMRAARMEAEERGAKPLAGLPSAGLTQRTIQGRTVSAEEQLDALIRSLTGRPDPVVLISRSFLNSFGGEPVQLDIAIYRNPLAVRAGDIVAERRVDGTKDLAAIHTQVTSFIAEDVHNAAQRANFIPANGRADSYGSVSMAEALNLVERIKEAGRSIRLQAIARQDLRVGDPLLLEFRLK
ncbi:MAG: DUF3084 domain-containing protein [Armatimonadetes bacterium]|nr:DUF3084 domain-containing protein [Armatimonadota bacterium]